MGRTLSRSQRDAKADGTSEAKCETWTELQSSVHALYPFHPFIRGIRGRRPTYSAGVASAAVVSM